jgi:hypothetical protein
MYARASRWIPVAPERVWAAAHEDRAGWAGWLPVATSDVVLKRLDDSASGAVRNGAGWVPVTWVVVRSIRQTLVLDARAGDRQVAQLRICLSPWDGGCAAEISFETAGGAGWLARRRLHGALASLERLATASSAESTTSAFAPASPRHRGSAALPRSLERVA